MGDSGQLRARARVFALLRVAVSASAFAWLFATVDRAALAFAFERLGAAPVLAAVALVACVVVIGTARWRILLRAYGASRVPSPVRALQLYLVGLFYNTYLPGAVGGDLVRGVASREAFGDDAAAGATAGVAVVFVERVLGLAGLVAVCAGAALAGASRVQGLGAVSALGLALAVGAVAAVALARRLGARLPGALGRRAAELPALRSVGGLLAVFALAVSGQLLLAATGHVVVSSIEPSVRLAESVVIFPLGAATAFFPLTVGGAGVREATLVALFATVGVGEASALAASLSVFGAQLVVAAAGGVWHLLRPLAVASPPPSGSPSA